MSRLAKSSIMIPSGVEVKISGNLCDVKGPKGLLQVSFPEGIVLDLTDNKLTVNYIESSGLKKPMHGLYWSLINNAVTGVHKGFQKELLLVGIGYKAAVKGSVLDLQLGFSHPSPIAIPDGIQVAVEKTTIKIQGADKQVVGQFAADVRAKRPPEPYKGKGVRYVDEHIRRKSGKSAKGK